MKNYNRTVYRRVSTHKDSKTYSQTIIFKCEFAEKLHRFNLNFCTRNTNRTSYHISLNLNFKYSHIVSSPKNNSFHPVIKYIAN